MEKSNDLTAHQHW